MNPLHSSLSADRCAQGNEGWRKIEERFAFHDTMACSNFCHLFCGVENKRPILPKLADMDSEAVTHAFVISPSSLWTAFREAEPHKRALFSSRLQRNMMYRRVDATKDESEQPRQLVGTKALYGYINPVLTVSVNYRNGEHFNISRHQSSGLSVGRNVEFDCALLDDVLLQPSRGSSVPQRCLWYTTGRHPSRFN